MIDYQGRQRIYDRFHNGGSVDGLFNSVANAVELKKENKELMKMVAESNEKLSVFFDKLLKGLANIYSSVSKRNEPVTIPKSFNVDNFDELEGYFRMLNDRLSSLALAISKVPQTKIELPKGKDKSNLQLLEVLANLSENIRKIQKQKLEFPDSFAINNFPPQMTPQPVTNININPLRGIVHTTAVTVTTALTPLPSYGVLDNRRSMIIFNNDSTNAIYIGGSDVTTLNGLPVLAQSYSPAVDSGPIQKWYGVATTSVNVRVCEVQNDSGA